MTHGSLFSGIGGFDLASEWMGWENRFHCEWNEFGQKVLKHYWPKSESYGDITKTDFTIWNGRIDILTGGFPCQPYSSAGRRLGTEDERHLWPEMLRAIREIQPRWVVGENVFGLVNWNDGMVFDEVQADLETEGYEVQPYVLPAVAVNAPHRRDRIWFVAHRDGIRCGGGISSPNQISQKNGRFVRTSNNTGTEFGAKLRDMIHLIPTPTLQDFTNSTFPPSQLNRNHVVGYLMREGISAGSQLNPRFVAEMMGYPPNWTELPFLNGETNP